MSDVTGDLATMSEAKGGSHAARISEVKAWLTSQFESAGREVPNFEYTHRSVSHLYNLATASQGKSQAATIVANGFRLQASEYRAQAARIREIMESAGMSQESLPSNVVSSAQVLANVANLLNIRDTELSSFLVAMGDISLRKTGVEEKRAKAQKESNVLLHFTRKAIQRLTYLKKILAQLEDDVVPCESQMENWKTNLEVMAIKEKQYMKQYEDYEMLLDRVGYTPKISHRELVEMAEHRKELEKMTKPVLDTLRSYQDLPPDKALAALAIEDKKRQFAAAEKYLEEGYEKEVKEITDGVSEEKQKESTMRLAWALVHSRQAEDIQLGINMLDVSLESRWSSYVDVREKLYLLAVGYYRTGDYLKSKSLVENCIQIQPDWRQASVLKKPIADKFLMGLARKK